MYDPALGRFHVIDPMTVFTPGISPYSYADNNPVNYIDYYGLGKKEREERRRERAKRQRERKQNRENNKRARERRRNAYKYDKGKKFNPNFTTYGPHEPREKDEREKIELDPLDRIEASLETPDYELDIVYRPPSPPTPEYNGNQITEDDPYTFSANINFNFQSNIYDIPATDKTLSDLVQTLTDYPQLEVIICGNAWGNVPSVTNNNAVWNRNSILNGNPSTLGGVASARAIAIKTYLEGKGISGSRIRAWRGNVYPDSPRGQSTTFQLRNP